MMGHSAPISSLSWSAEGLLLSGSWDETARGWAVETGECKWVLRGHENNVCVLGLGPGSILTGSTGLEVDGHLVGEQIRMWEGFPPKECRSLTDHTSGIRDLCHTDDDHDDGEETARGGGAISMSSSKTFCSGSNDGTVRAWSGDGDCVAVYTVPGESFVFGVEYLGGGLVAAVDDAGNLSAASLPSPPPPSSTPTKKNASLVYKHPKTVWSVAALPGWKSCVSGVKKQRKTPLVCDVATGSADFMVRVFTPDPARALRGEELKEAEEAVGVGGDGGCGSEFGGGAGGGERLPSLSEMGVMVGGEDGQLSAFYDEATGEAKVFRWMEAVGKGGGSSRWEPLGSLKPPVRKVSFEGGLYDKVIPVEVDSASRGLLVFQLGVNDGDDPKSVATAFCQKHQLGPEYLPQIEQFLFLTSLS